MKYLFLVLLAGISAASSAQSFFSLKDCIDYTLLHHNSVKVYANNSNIARAKSAQTVGLYLPAINGSATMVDNMQLQSTVLPAGIFGPDPKIVQLGTKYNTNLSVDVNQTIYDQSKIVAINTNKPYVQMTELQQQQNKEQITYNTATAYFQALIFKEQLTLLRINEHKYEEMAKVLEYQFSKGTVLEKDVDRVKVNLNTTRYQIEDAYTKENLALNSLKNAMGMELNTILEISDSINYESLVYTPMTNQLTPGNLTETRINELAVTLQEYSLRSKKASYLPTLSFSGKWGNQALNNDFSKAWYDWNNYSYVALSLNVPLFNGLRKKNAVKEEKLKLNNEQLNLKINQQNLQLRYDNAKSSVTTAFSAYKSNKDNMELAKKVLSVTDYQYQLGVASLTDYLNDDAAYKAAQTNYINSLYNLMISQLSYQQSQGSLPEFLNSIK